MFILFHIHMMMSVDYKQLINITIQVYEYLNYMDCKISCRLNLAVQYILDSVMVALDQNPDRRFIYVEIAFFWRWWNEQTDDVRNKVKEFVNDGK